MKKVLALLLVLMLVGSLFVACGSDNEDSKETSSKATESVPVTESSEVEESSEEESKDIYAGVRDFDLGGRDVVFLVYDDSRTRYKSFEILTHEDNEDIINEAIQTRNDIVEALLHCKITEVRTADVLSDARNDVMGGGVYDIFMPYMPDAGTLATEDSLVNLMEYNEILHLENSCWDQRANDNLSIGNKLYYTVGDFCLLAFDCTHAIVFNKTVVKNNPEIEDPYTLLSEGKWTYDALYRNAKLADTTSNGTDDDIYGFLINQNYVTTLYMGSGERLTSKSAADDLPIISCNGEKATIVTNKIKDIYNDTTSTHPIETLNANKYSDVWSAASGAIGEDRCLFRSLALVDLKDLSDYDCAYGLLPTPKYTEEQDEYYNIVSIVLAPVPCISTQCESIEESCAVIAAMAAASTDTVRSAYYDFVLKGRKIADEQGEEALDIMFNNRVYELATVYLFNGLNTLIIDSTTTTSGNITQNLASYGDTYQAAIDDIVSFFVD